MLRCMLGGKIDINARDPNLQSAEGALREALTRLLVAGRDTYCPRHASHLLRSRHPLALSALERLHENHNEVRAYHLARMKAKIAPHRS
ncbi:hypothetical protein PsorP6_001429 [Peronosclerospora sorghi]|uniref:Uncharacterized protein n=1 Tax=Peronosclerospora sorghi TaxID=230839 RepID=A0ACC0WYA7_9STRA|nr:hypothetical protein PsorP6_001429 [Peronosclerospora sorghi]